MLHLDTIGMIRFMDGESNMGSGFDRDQGFLESKQPIQVNYYGVKMTLSSYAERVPFSGLPIGRAKLTQIGTELFPICGSASVKGFFECVCLYEWLPFIAAHKETTVESIRNDYNNSWETLPLPDLG